MKESVGNTSGHMIEASGDRSIAAHSIGVAITGNDARVVSLPETAVHWAREVSVPSGAGILPRPASHRFMGRDEELTQLRDLLTSGGDAAVTQSGSQAVHGLGGVGKSALALHYAHRFRHEYSLVWWITAESANHIQTGLAALAQHLCPQWATSADEDARAAWALIWLQWHSGWLIIFDNVEDPNDLSSYWGTLTRGHRIATSRKTTGWQHISPTMPLDLLDSVSATDLLCTLALNGEPPSLEQREQAAELAKDLGYLPLALEQAGAYLYQTGSDITAYRTDLGILLDDASDGIDSERTIARIWNQTLKAIAVRNPLSVILLQAIAWLAPDAIPRTLLSPLAPDLRGFNNALGVLHAYSMINFSAAGNLGVHRLVQAVLRTNPSDQTDSPAGLREAERLIREILYPTGVDELAPAEHWEHAITHILALAANTPTSHTSDQADDLYEPVASYMYDQSQSARAIPLYRILLAHREATLGKKHPDTLGSRINLAAAYQEAGNLEQALPIFETTLTQCEEVLGIDHPQTLIASNNLGHAYEAAGNVKQAISLHKATLVKRTNIFGAAHPKTLTSLNNLAYAYEASGNLGEAIPLYKDSLAAHEQVLGDMHPQTLHSRFNLARACMEAGNLAEALDLHRGTLAQREIVLGDIHPKTLDSRNDLARVYQATGDLLKAISLHEATLTQRQQVLGEVHPDTLQSINNLAFAYQESGDFELAVQSFQAALVNSIKALGDTHPTTLRLRANLAFTYQQMRDFAHALPLLRVVLTQREKVLSDAHPDILFSRHNLASAYQESGDPGQAIELHVINLPQCERVMGKTHDLTLQARLNLARSYEKVGDFKRAIPLLEETLTSFKEALGDAHLNTLKVQNSLASTYFASKDFKRAIQLFKNAVSLCEQGLGETHPYTLKSRLNLASTYQRTGNVKRAIALHETTLNQCKQILGDNHPQTLQGCNNLAAAYCESGNPQRAIQMLERTLVHCKKVLGDTHPQTLQCSRNLANAHRMAQAVQPPNAVTDYILRSSGESSAPEK
ncbi:tetratricopeptide repeat protein [Streptomyces sp. NPDC060022]|uniref:tetratricopeptide repeat protein n=1 Tax=Streptomyces sp. NPDC060022 TaxID=3347039 RepID=UPI00369AFDF2